MNKLPEPVIINRADDYWYVMKSTQKAKYSYILEKGYYEYKAEQQELISASYDIYAALKEKREISKFFKEAVSGYNLYKSKISFMQTLSHMAYRYPGNDLKFSCFSKMKKVVELYKKWESDKKSSKNAN